MDAVVGSSELLSLIFGWVQELPGPNACLFVCSTVNKLWHLESCRLLWKRQSDLTNVILLLRQGGGLPLLSPYERKRAASGSISIERFLHYSRWISHLSCPVYEMHEDLKDAFILAKGTLFPRLETWDFIRIDKYSSVTALVLLGPRLKKINFSRYISPEDAVLIMSNMEGIQLIELLMPQIIPAADDRSQLPRILHGQQSLQHLSLHPHWVDLDVLYALGSLPRLSMLRIMDSKRLPPAKATICDAAVQGQLKPRDAMFPSLKTLIFCSYCLVWLKLSDVTFTDTGLRRVELDLTYPDDANIPEESAIIWPPGCRLADLQHIIIRLAQNNHASIPRAAGRTLQPLSSCNLLQKLHLRMPRVPKINNAELLSLARNWPNLTDLHFAETTMIKREDTFGLSINVLGEIPAICPKISSLTLPCSSSVGLETSRKVQSGTLKKLDLGPSFLLDSQLDDWSDRLLKIEAYLAMILPLSCTLTFGINRYSLKLDDHITMEEWDQMMTAHEQTTTLISNHRAAIYMANRLQMQLDPPQASL